MAGRAALIVLLLCAWPAAARADNIIKVNTQADVVNASDGNCSLREALLASNGAGNTTSSGSDTGECPPGSSGLDEIVVPAGDYPFTNTTLTPLPGIDTSNGPVTISGAGSSSTRIHHFETGYGRAPFIHVYGQSEFRLDDVTIADFGSSPYFSVNGGAIQNDATGGLTVERCVFSGNIGSTGGAIFNSGQLTIRDSEFMGNRASFGVTGGNQTGATGPDGSPGGVGGSATGTNGTGGANGGAIANTGNLTIDRSIFTGNGAGDGGFGGTGTGGNGGNGVNTGSAGGAGGVGTGGNGGSGGSGGALWISITGASTSVSITDSTITQNDAGNGGDGGWGYGGTGGTGQAGGIGPGGAAGAGGAGIGGAGGTGGRGAGVYVRIVDPSAGSALTVVRSLITGNFIGHGGGGGSGIGGNAGVTGTGAATRNGSAGGAGTGGTGGPAGMGAGWASDSYINQPGFAVPQMTNVTVTGNVAAPSSGGGGAAGGQGSAGTSGGSAGATGASTAGAGGSAGGGQGILYDVLNASHLTVSSNDGVGLWADRAQDTPGAGGTDIHINGNAGVIVNSIVASNGGGNCGTSDSAFQVVNNVSYPDATCGAQNGDPKLAALADNGGFTQTQALGAGSSAIDLVPLTDFCALTDERGAARPGLAACDAGAYEVAPPIPVTGDASAITTAAATLGGSVNPNARASSYHFEYGPTDSYGSSTPTQNTNAGVSPVAVSADLSGLTASTTYHYRLVATNADGAQNGADRTFTVAAAASGSENGGTTGAAGGGSTSPLPGNAASADTTPPRFLSASITPVKLKTAASLKFALSEAAEVTITVESVQSGRRVGSRCVKPSPSNAKQRSCLRFTRIARIEMAGTAGANQKTLLRKLGGRRLAPGQYRVTLQGVDAAGNRSAPKRLTFRVVS